MLCSERQVYLYCDPSYGQDKFIYSEQIVKYIRFRLDFDDIEGIDTY